MSKIMIQFSSENKRNENRTEAIPSSVFDRKIHTIDMLLLFLGTYSKFLLENSLN